MDTNTLPTIDVEKIYTSCHENFLARYHRYTMLFTILFFCCFALFVIFFVQLIQDIPHISNLHTIYLILSFLGMLYTFYLRDIFLVKPQNILSPKSHVFTDYLSKRTLQILIAESTTHTFITTNDATLFTALFQSSILEPFFVELNILHNSQFLVDIQHLPSGNHREQIYKTAYIQAQKNQFSQVEPEHLFYALIAANQEMAALLARYDISLEEVDNIVYASQFKREKLETVWTPDHRATGLNTTNASFTSLPTPTLNMYSVDLTTLAQEHKLARFIGREEILADAKKAIEKAVKGNLFIVGNNGVGKTALVEELAVFIHSDEAPDFLHDKRLVLWKLDELLASSKDTQSFEQTFAKTIKEVTDAKNIILYFENIDHLTKDTTNLLSPLVSAIGRNSFQCIATASEKGFNTYFEKDASLIEHFTTLHLPEPDRQTTIKIVEVIAAKLESTYHIEITYDAISTLVELSQKYIYDTFLPRKAITLLENIVNEAVSAKRTLVDIQMVKQYMSTLTSIPLTDMTKDETAILEQLEDTIHAEIISQHHAVAAIANAIRRSRSGLTNKSRPIASFLFYGPTGVGKTQVAKALAKAYFGSDTHMIRFDMSEYQLQTSITEFVSKLATEVKHHPFALFLLDEFEKADKDIVNVLLQILDDARLTYEGTTYNFSNTIIICTSNAASADIYTLEEQNKSWEEIEQVTKDKLVSFFKPELLNRFDHIIFFKPLSSDELMQIAKLLLNEVAESLAQKHYTISFDDAIASELVQKIDNKTYGARPIRRLIESEIEDYIAKKIIAQKIQKNTPITYHSLSDIQGA